MDYTQNDIMEENVDEAKRVEVFRLYSIVAEGKRKNIKYSSNIRWII
jgi:hypothetical protein